MRLAPAPPDRLEVRQGLASMRSWPARRWAVAALAALGTALVTGVPTGIVETSFYTRMTPVTWWDYPFWTLTVVLVGLTAATYVQIEPAPLPDVPDRARRAAGATLLSVFAVGCPICNKLVVAVLGISGALTYFAPVQPLLGLIGVGLLGAGLVLRLRRAVACPTPTA